MPGEFASARRPGLAESPDGRDTAMPYVRVGTVFVAALAFVLAQNSFGHELNAFFLRLPGIDKVLHVIEYALIFTVLFAIATGIVPDRRPRARQVLGAGVIVAIFDESVQSFGPGRTVEGMDFVANLCGLVIGWVLMARPRRRLAAAAGGLAVLTAALATWNTHALLIDYSRALRYERQHDFIRAREHYRRALAAGLSSAGLFNAMAWVEVESGIGDPSRAVEYARKALDMQPGSANVLDTYGWALHYAGRSSEALPILQEAFRKDPDIFCIDYHLGATYLALGRRTDAERHFRRQTSRIGTREATFARQALSEIGARP